jgi:hypothetical protein
LLPALPAASSAAWTMREYIDPEPIARLLQARARLQQASLFAAYFFVIVFRSAPCRLLIAITPFSRLMWLALFW